MPTEDRRVGKLLPSPVTPPDTVCYTIQIPNAVQYRAAFLGQIGKLGDWATWDHPTDGTVCVDCETAAQLWRNAIAGGQWSDDCEIDMSCSDVADCIENDPATRAAVTAAAAQTATPGTTTTPGQPMTPGQYNANLTPTDDCDPDVLWAQTEQLVDYIISAGIDMMEQIEVYTNGIEAAGFVEMIPILGTLFDEAQLDQVIDFLDWSIEVAAEIFAAADTAENRNAIKCAIFCACKDNCTITIQKLWEVENERLGGLLDPASITGVEGLITTIVTLGTNPALPLDVWFTFTVAMAKLAGYLGVKGIDYSLNLLLKLAVNDANNDWELLCEDCPPGDWCHAQDLTSDVTNIVFDYDQDGAPYRTVWIEGSGIIGNRVGALDENIPQIALPSSRQVKHVEFEIEITGNTSNAWAFCAVNGIFATPIPLSTGGMHTYSWDLDTVDADFVMFGVDAGGPGRPSIGTLKSVQLGGEGSNPFGADNC